MAELYSSVPGITNIVSININESHNSPSTIVNIEAENIAVDIGDEITIDLGFTDNHALVFDGYIKTIDKNIPKNTYQITAYDYLIRATDFFIVSSTPENPFKRRNISAESLVHDLLELAGLTLLTGNPTYVSPTYFTFGINSDVEINLISCYDICKQLADIITWSLWTDENKNLFFKNRRPYVMTYKSEIPGHDADTSINTGSEVTNAKILDYTYKVTEKNLRNKVIVYGSTGVTAENSSATSYDPRDDTQKAILPAGFYKSIVAGLPYIDEVSEAQDSADYNLDLYNRLTESTSISIEGRPDFHSRKVITVDGSVADIDGNWYIYSCEHSLSAGGYLLNMELTR